MKNDSEKRRESRTKRKEMSKDSENFKKRLKIDNLKLMP